MKSFKSFSVAILGIMLLFSSCVSQKKFDELNREKQNTSIDNERLRSEINQKDKILEELSKVKDENDQLNVALKDKTRSYEGLKNTYDKLKSDYEGTLAQNQDLINIASAEKGELSDALARQQSLLNKKEKELNTLEENLRVNQRKLDELQESLAAKEMVMTNLRNKITNSLLGFSSSDLSIRQENGKVYVSLSQNLLFAKGSTTLDNAGKDALKKLADVLNENPDIDINVEGHTDPDGSVDRNWDLSVNRATTIVKLLSSYGVSPERITASGRALFNPVAPNDTEANKSKNRRTEIILSPKLDELYDLINPKG